jgi:hypothetical protein
MLFGGTSIMIPLLVISFGGALAIAHYAKVGSARATPLLLLPNASYPDSTDLPTPKPIPLLSHHRYQHCGYCHCQDNEPPPVIVSAPLALVGFMVAASWIDIVADQLVSMLTFGVSCAGKHIGFESNHE